MKLASAIILECMLNSHEPSLLFLWKEWISHCLYDVHYQMPTQIPYKNKNTSLQASF